MTDYSSLVDDEVYLIRTPLDADCAPRSTEKLLLVIDEDGAVSLEERTYYGGDGIPSDEWHKRTLTYLLATGPCVIDVETLRADLAEDGELSKLIARVIDGHSVEWDGNNLRGRLDEDAQDADEAIDELAEGAGFPRYVDEEWAVWGGWDWLHGGGPDEWILDSFGLTLTSTSEDIAAVARQIEVDARSEKAIVLDLEDELEECIARVRKAAAEAEEDV